jgi:hypothetical protein
MTTALAAREPLRPKALPVGLVKYGLVVEDFSTGLGTMERDAQGNPMYSAAQFGKTLQNNRAAVEQAFGTDGAATLD